MVTFNKICIKCMTIRFQGRFKKILKNLEIIKELLIKKMCITLGSSMSTVFLNGFKNTVIFLGKLLNVMCCSHIITMGT